MYICIYACVCIHTHVRMYVCMYACMYIYKHTHIYIIVSCLQYGTRREHYCCMTPSGALGVSIAELATAVHSCTRCPRDNLRAIECDACKCWCRAFFFWQTVHTLV